MQCSLCIAFVLAVSVATPSAAPYHRTTAADILDPSSSVSSQPTGVVKVSPECWKRATAVLQTTYRQNKKEPYRHHNTEDATKLCQALPEAHQKKLALEIARCHLQDLGRTLYRSSAAERECTTTTAANLDQEAIHSCLKQLTDSGENAYTQYVSYVQILCIQLTQEVLLEYQQSVQDEVASKYAALAGQSIQNMEAIYQMSKSHAEQMQSISEIPAILRDQMTRELKDQLKETLDEQLRDRIAELLQNQASEQATFWGNLMDHLELRNQEHQERVNDWTSYQTMLWQKQAREMAIQSAALDEQRMRMEHLSKTVAETAENFQPLVGLQSLLKVATNGYTWMMFLLHFLGTFNVVWLITRPEMCHVFRSYLFGIVFGEAILEFALTAAVQYELLTETGHVACITELRHWTLLLECIAFLIGLLGSCCIGVSKTSETNGALAMHNNVGVAVSTQQQQLAACLQFNRQEQHGTAVNRRYDEHADFTHANLDHRNSPCESKRGHSPDALGRSVDQSKPTHRHTVQLPNRLHNSDLRNDACSNSGFSRGLSVFHHRPPVVIKMKHSHPAKPQMHGVQEMMSPELYCGQHHQPKPAMLYPRRFSTKPDSLSLSSPIPARCNEVPAERVSIPAPPEMEQEREPMEVTYNNNVTSPRARISTKFKRPAITTPEEEPAPKKTARVYW